LQAYAAKFELPVRLSTNVTSLTRGNGTYVAKAGDEALEARQVVVATGPFHVPFIPPIADGLDPGVYQVHSAGYRHPQTVPPGSVLVAGRRQLRMPDRPGTLGDPQRGTLGRPSDPGDSAAAAGP